MTEGPDHHDKPVTPLGRSAQSMLLRRWPEFFIEFILIIAGILVALAIDGWAQDREDRKSERTYLELLRDDLDEIEIELQGYVDFETANMTSGAELYRLLDPEAQVRDSDYLQRNLAIIGGRRTVQINSAAYTDLQSTGNLQVIRNQNLRQDIVRYFTRTERVELVIEKNNTAFVDYSYTRFLHDSGISTGLVGARIGVVHEANELLSKLLGDDFSLPHDPILHQPAGASTWSEIQRRVLFRSRISSIGVILASQTIDATREIREAIEEELRNPI